MANAEVTYDSERYDDKLKALGFILKRFIRSRGTMVAIEETALEGSTLRLSGVLDLSDAERDLLIELADDSWTTLT